MLSKAIAASRICFFWRANHAWHPPVVSVGLVTGGRSLSSSSQSSRHGLDGEGVGFFREEEDNSR